MSTFFKDLFIGSDTKDPFFSFTKLTFFVLVIATLFITYEQLKWNAPFAKDSFQLFATIVTSLLGYIIGKSAGQDTAKQVSDSASASAATALTVPGNGNSVHGDTPNENATALNASI